MSVTAFDSDVLIYAVIPGHPLGRRVASHLDAPDIAAIGSVFLLPEVLTKPIRLDPESEERAELEIVLGRIELQPFDEPTARFSLDLAATYGLHAANAAHLATAVTAGADCFLTNNRKDFPKTIAEIAIVYPEDLAEVEESS